MACTSTPVCLLRAGMGASASTSDVKYIMRQHGYHVINYSFGAPLAMDASFRTLYTFMNELGLTISENKLVQPTTQATCLGLKLAQ